MSTLKSPVSVRGNFLIYTTKLPHSGSKSSSVVASLFIEEPAAARREKAEKEKVEMGEGGGEDSVTSQGLSGGLSWALKTKAKVALRHSKALFKEMVR